MFAASITAKMGRFLKLEMHFKNYESLALKWVFVKRVNGTRRLTGNVLAFLYSNVNIKSAATTKNSHLVHESSIP